MVDFHSLYQLLHSQVTRIDFSLENFETTEIRPTKLAQENSAGYFFR